jgi:hypothetical protein
MRVNIIEVDKDKLRDMRITCQHNDQTLKFFNKLGEDIRLFGIAYYTETAARVDPRRVYKERGHLYLKNTKRLRR